eukprot:CAMPEP_0197651572 /NCGR_PEP_ID=MMETSP1338-20131121/33142_1 /TAXON_ID=43686 ORGANISM="Pelagodinium beii, Strain RCC1491" /NCGR_SAMPLE_ID=MMETSP1338 /ASSEMBLY_ACC=CAM_ASM_000754 /LENGTH=55 /DNA_ID=CAMNT_0043226243 /DNA_START=54 /DNA_END=218 /DNA_ORIENTATION=-
MGRKKNVGGEGGDGEGGCGGGEEGGSGAGPTQDIASAFAGLQQMMGAMGGQASGS